MDALARELGVEIYRLETWPSAVKGLLVGTFERFHFRFRQFRELTFPSSIG